MLYHLINFAFIFAHDHETFSLKLHADDIFLVSNRTLLYYDLLLIVTAVFNGCCESLGFKGFFDD